MENIEYLKEEWIELNKRHWELSIKLKEIDDAILDKGLVINKDFLTHTLPKVSAIIEEQDTIRAKMKTIIEEQDKIRPKISEIVGYFQSLYNP